MDAKKLAALIQKYQDGQCSDEERHLVEKLYHGFDTAEDTLPGKDAMAAHYNDLFAKIKDDIAVPPAPERKVRLFHLQWTAAAAVLLLAALGAWIFFLPSKQATVATNNSRPAESVKKRFIKLPDGSSVLLNTGSELKYPPVFEGASREVYLSGEGYFDITANISQPFIVHTGNVTTTVLGTVFNVKAMPGEGQITVTVAKGKVKVAAGGKSFGVISSNEQISVGQTTATHSRAEQVNFQPVVNWACEDMVFNNVTYAEAAAVLHEKYGVQVVFQNRQLEQCRFTTSFVRQSSLEDILHVLCAFNQSSFNIKDSIVTISGGSCQ